ncbi:MAG: glycosyltransferase [Deltaproteobacteria bacterium]|nr:glycosyltransferase [Deltaproteobacteria bacterium]MBI3295062.1 glycosyltransferase [Deltaproteobacteria bacterium]
MVYKESWGDAQMVWIVFILALITAYLYGLLWVGTRRDDLETPPYDPYHRFLIIIPAHNEEWVIAGTVTQARALTYPVAKFSVHVVADHCSDATVERAREAGAIVFDRKTGAGGTKAKALSAWFERVRSETFDAVVILDADAQVQSGFLRWMDAALTRGESIVQGQQIISNPEKGWYPALTAAMYRVENAIHNSGVSALGGSARHMGDAIAIRKGIIEELGFGDSLTEDHALRQKIILSGRRIAYEHRSRALNEAAQTWTDAKIQRARWMQGTQKEDHRNRRALFRTLFRDPTAPVLFAVVESVLPSFSLLTILAAVLPLLCLWLDRNFLGSAEVVFLAVFALPFVGLVLTEAPAALFRALLAAPIFIVWRATAAVRYSLFPANAGWKRTPHGERSDG